MLTVGLGVLFLLALGCALFFASNNIKLKARADAARIEKIDALTRAVYWRSLAQAEDNEWFGRPARDPKTGKYRRRV